MLDRFQTKRESALGALAILLCALPAYVSAASTPVRDLDAGLQAKGAFSVPATRAGDTIEYRLRVEWREVPAALMVLPPRDELKTPGFTLIGQSALHRKTASAGSIRNISEFSYLLVAHEKGLGRVESFALRYRNDLRGRVESTPVSGSSIEIGPARIPFLERSYVRAGLAILAVAGIILIVTAGMIKRRQRQAETESNSVEDEFTRAIVTLKNRCDAADSRSWLQEAEKLCVTFLCRDLGVSNMRDVRFEAALDHYLTRKSTLTPPEVESWTKLRDLFHEARYAGGRKEPHELREACRHLKICLSPMARTHSPSVARVEKLSEKMENA